MLDTSLIDFAEMFARKMDLNFSRTDDNEISLQLRDGLSDYNLSIITKQGCDVAYFVCDTSLIVPQKKYRRIADAVIEVNERIWLGHFDILSAGHCLVYSLALPFLSYFSMDENMMETVIHTITEECNRFYHYFSILIENKKMPNFSVGSLFLEAAGEA